MQDALTYDEPPIWYFPVREELGTELLAAGEANRAEAIYRADLKINPGNPRSLKGLTETLRTWLPQGARVGWLDGEDLFLDIDSAYGVARAAAAGVDGLAVGKSGA
jgi:hypothetical protein